MRFFQRSFFWCRNTLLTRERREKDPKRRFIRSPIIIPSRFQSTEVWYIGCDSFMHVKMANRMSLHRQKFVQEISCSGHLPGILGHKPQISGLNGAQAALWWLLIEERINFTAAYRCWWRNESVVRVIYGFLDWFMFAYNQVFYLRIWGLSNFRTNSKHPAWRRRLVSRNGKTANPSVASMITKLT